MPTENGLKSFLPLCCLSFSAGLKAKLVLRSYGRCSRCSGEAGTEDISPYQTEEISHFSKHLKYAKYARNMQNMQKICKDLKFVKKFTRPDFRAKEFYALKTRKSRLFSLAINSENASL